MSKIDVGFDIDAVVNRLRTMVQPFPKAALFDLYDQGYTSIFELLIACMISIRTYDEVTVPTSPKLFTLGRTPKEIATIPISSIQEAIKDCSYSDTKATQIHTIAKAAVEEWSGELPCDFDILTSFKGIGPKCASLALGIACNKPFIGVDIHVHRVTNRWGYVNTKTPEKTMKVLEEKLPEKYWVEINKLLVPFGKHICTGNLPKCSVCLLNKECMQIGVKKHR